MTVSAPRERRHAAVVFHPRKAVLGRLRPAVAEEERLHGWGRTRWYETRSDDSGCSAAQQALEDGAAVVLVAGGDGTVRAVAEVIHGTGVAIAVIPAGTGNLLARELRTPLDDISACVSSAFSGAVRAVDVGVAELEDDTGARRTHVFVVMAGMGLDAEMAQNTHALAKKHLGWLAYITPIARSILVNRLFHLDYRVDGGRARSTRAHTVIVGNCGTLAGNMLLIPAAVIDDGLLDVVMMRPKGRWGWAGIGARLTLQGWARRSRFTGRLLEGSAELRSLAYAHGTRFEARFDTPHLLQLDGDSLGYVSRVRISIRPGALHVRTAG
ncbi:diacylglycerol/lipid kinase family protein [Microbacterium sp. RD1]|uniref:diacylglycerol/lipid kinase family protein n=1 Tax=Microbacterium sp. RD1 TaxID=3457313 RepID=UPI003FA52B1F